MIDNINKIYEDMAASSLTQCADSNAFRRYPGINLDERALDHGTTPGSGGENPASKGVPAAA